MNFKTKLLITLIKVVGGTFIFAIVATAGFAVIDIISFLFGFKIAHPLSDTGRYLAYPLIPIVIIYYIYLKLQIKEANKRMKYGIKK